MIQNPNVRKAIYALTAAVLAVLAAKGLISKDDAGTYEHIVELAGTLVTLLAASHTPKPAP